MKLLNKDNGLDEMQMQRRNKIGHQTFVLLGCALFLDNCLYNIGVEWMDYPQKNMIFINSALFLYIIRLFIADANEPPQRKSSKLALIISWVLVLLMLVIAVAFGFFEIKADNSEVNAEMFFYIAGGIGVVMMCFISIIKSVKNRKNDDE